MSKTFHILYGFIILFLVFSLFFLYTNLQKPQYQNSPSLQSEEKDVHYHADMKMYIFGKPYDLNQPKYMFKDGKELDENVHFHNNNSEVVHVHKSGITWGNFFKSLGIQIDKDCVIIDTGESYCNGNQNTLNYFVNGVKVDSLKEIEIADLSRVLITFGSNDSLLLKQQKESVTDKSCIASGKCTDREDKSILDEPCTVGKPCVK